MFGRRTYAHFQRDAGTWCKIDATFSLRVNNHSEVSKHIHSEMKSIIHRISIMDRMKTITPQETYMYNITMVYSLHSFTTLRHTIDKIMGIFILQKQQLL